MRGKELRVSPNRVYRLLLKEYGRQGWWPGDTPFEVSIGAILTQNVSWTNVEKAIKILKEKGLLDPHALAGRSKEQIAPLIKSTGYYNQKSIKLKNFLEWFSRYDFSFSAMDGKGTGEVRKELLSVNGIGPETADSILLYAMDRKIFVVDAYTIRIFSRIGLLSGEEKYSQVQKIFHDKFRGELYDYQEFHALIVNHGKDICKKRPLCQKCCLMKLCGSRSTE